jgi:hypothetical protein
LADIESASRTSHKSRPMASPPTYTEYQPPIDLALWIACFWQIASEIADGSPVLHHVLPDGCADSGRFQQDRG